MEKEILKYMKRERMFTAGDHVIAGVSGGADSVCLLHLLVQLSGQLGIRVSAIHVHHGIRGAEADRDQRFTEELCRREKVPCTVVRVNVPEYACEHGLSLEEAGRMLRYEAFEREAEHYSQSKIAVAHHADDEAETILHHLFRGSGLKGLGGMKPVRGQIVRPLLETEKKEILSYLDRRGLGFCEDSTNQSGDYTRNKLRNQIIPLVVSEVNDRAVGHILHAGKLISQADSYLERTVGRILDASAVICDRGIGFPATQLLEEDPVIQSYLVLAMMARACGERKDLTAVHVEQVLGLIHKPVGKELALPYAQKAVRDYEHLWIEPSDYREDVDNQAEILTEKPVFEVFSYEKGSEIPKKRYTKWFDYDKIKGTLSVRTRETGDYITLSGGGRKTVKSYMIDQKIPSRDRDKIKLVADGNHILWIVGYRISEYYKVTEQTKTIIQVEFDGGKNDGR